MISPTASSTFAVRDLRNLPDDVTVALLQNETYAAALTDHPTPLSLPVFEHLWTRFSANTDLAILIVTRALTPAQRALVLASEKRVPVLRMLTQYNILTYAELKCTPINKVAHVLSYNALSYYEDNPAVMEYLAEHLSDGATICYQMRRPLEDLSDDAVLDATTTYFDRTTHNLDADRKTPQVPAVRDLAEIRPQLVGKLVKIPDARVHLAIAESRFAANEDVLEALLNCSVAVFTTSYARNEVHPEVLRALARNLVVPKEVRIACADAVNMTWTNPLAYSVEVTISPQYATIENWHHLEWLVRRTLASSDPFGSHSCQDWDILEIAKNPNLRKYEAKKLLQILGYTTVQHRLGANRSYAAIRALCDRIGDADVETIPGLMPPTPVRGFAPDPLRPVSFLSTVEQEFSSRFGSPKDPASLIQVLGQTPHAWLTFIQALDTVDPTTTIQKVIDTTVRLAYAL